MAGHRVAASHCIKASWVVPGAADPAVADRTLTVVDGRIAAVEESAGNGSLVLPALANAHDHARVVRLSQVGSFDVPLGPGCYLARHRGRSGLPRRLRSAASRAAGSVRPWRTTHACRD